MLVDQFENAWGEVSPSPLSADDYLNSVLQMLPPISLTAYDMAVREIRFHYSQGTSAYNCVRLMMFSEEFNSRLPEDLALASMKAVDMKSVVVLSTGKQKDPELSTGKPGSDVTNASTRDPYFEGNRD